LPECSDRNFFGDSCFISFLEWRSFSMRDALAAHRPSAFVLDQLVRLLECPVNILDLAPSGSLVREIAANNSRSYVGLGNAVGEAVYRVSKINASIVPVVSRVPAKTLDSSDPSTSFDGTLRHPPDSFEADALNGFELGGDTLQKARGFGVNRAGGFYEPNEWKKAFRRAPTRFSVISTSVSNFASCFVLEECSI
jgi:hypothetical protein